MVKWVEVVLGASNLVELAKIIEWRMEHYTGKEYYLGSSIEIVSRGQVESGDVKESRFFDLYRIHLNGDKICKWLAGYLAES